MSAVNERKLPLTTIQTRYPSLRSGHVGNIHEHIDIVDGRKNGSYVEYFDIPLDSNYIVGFHNYIKRKGNFIDDLEDGTWEYFLFQRIEESKSSIEDGKYKFDYKMIPESVGSYTKGIRQGTWKFFDNEGRIQRMITYKNGEMEGPYEEYYSNRQLSEKGFYSNNYKHGVIYTYYLGKKEFSKYSRENKGIIKSISKYEKDVIVSYRNFDTEGNLVEEKGPDPEYHYVYGKQGKIIAEGKIIDGKRDGKWIFQEKNTSVNYVKGMINEQWFYYPGSDKIEISVKYLPDNVEHIKFYDEESRITQFKVVKNKKTQKITTYKYNSSFSFVDIDADEYLQPSYDEMISLREYSDGKALPSVKGKIYKNKSVKYFVGEYTPEGLRNGFWTCVTLFDKEKHKVEINYQNGKLNGPFTSYTYKNGNYRKYLVGQYDKNKKVGVWKKYNEEGKLIKLISYSDKTEEITEFDEDGKVNKLISRIMAVEFIKEFNKNEKIIFESSRYGNHTYVKTIFKYDESNRLIKKIRTKEKNNIASEYDEYIYEYDEEGRDKANITYKKINEELLITSKIIYEYDEEGRDKVEIVYEKIGEELLISSKTIYEYIDNNKKKLWYTTFNPGEELVLGSIDIEGENIHYDIGCDMFIFDHYKSLEEYLKEGYRFVSISKDFTDRDDYRSGKFSYSERHDFETGELSIIINENGVTKKYKGLSVIKPGLIDPNYRFEMFNLNDPWKWFKDSFVARETASDYNENYTGPYKKYRQTKESVFKIKEGFYKEGKKIGRWITYNSSGEIESIGRYEDDLKIDLWEYYLVIDNIRYKDYGYYIKDLKNGLWKREHEGKLFSDTEYFDGVEGTTVQHFIIPVNPPSYQELQKEEIGKYILPQV